MNSKCLAAGDGSNQVHFSLPPTGNTAYHLAVTLNAMANPLMAFLAMFLPCSRGRIIAILTALGSAVAAYILATALHSPDTIASMSTGGALVVRLHYFYFSSLSLSHSLLSLSLSLSLSPLSLSLSLLYISLSFFPHSLSFFYLSHSFLSLSLSLSLLLTVRYLFYPHFFLDFDLYKHYEQQTKLRYYCPYILSLGHCLACNNTITVVSIESIRRLIKLSNIVVD